MYNIKLKINYRHVFNLETLDKNV